MITGSPRIFRDAKKSPQQKAAGAKRPYYSVQTRSGRGAHEKINKRKRQEKRRKA
jgi:hypothetical protein